LIAIHPAMSRDDAIIFSDLTGKLAVVNVACDKCGRAGCYRLNRLIENHGSVEGSSIFSMRLPPIVPGG